MSLPLPDGPHATGCVAHTLIDDTRPSHLLGTERGRRLRLKMWYPAARGYDAERELVWSDLRNRPQNPAPMRLMLSLLRQRTASRPAAPFASDASSMRLIVYNHGLVSFAEENSSLMDAMASRGYTVIAIEHQDQMEEFRTLARARSANQQRHANELARNLARATPTERAARAREYYEASPDTNRIVRERAADTRLVLDRVSDVLACIPHGPRDASISGVQLVGYSVGGAVATEVALQDHRALSVVNLDGGTQGSIDATTLAVPCLMLYSEISSGINDALLPARALRETFAGTRHLNFHDIAGLLPLLRLTPALGSTAPATFLAKRNDRVCRFIDGRRAIQPEHVEAHAAAPPQR